MPVVDLPARRVVPEVVDPGDTVVVIRDLLQPNTSLMILATAAFT
jgi:hypothetical protein